MSKENTMKAGDAYESPGGLGFVIKKVDKQAVTVDVERVYRDKNGDQEVRVNQREVPLERFALFSKAYRKV